MHKVHAQLIVQNSDVLIVVLEMQSQFAMVLMLVTALKLMRLSSIEREDLEREQLQEIQIMLRILQYQLLSYNSHMLKLIHFLLADLLKIKEAH